MENNQSFLTNSKFYADEHFRYGLARSGEFLSSQVTLLENHGHAYQALHNGDRQPTTDEEKHFVEVCKGFAEATTNHEKAWQRFCFKTQHRTVILPFGKTKTAETGDDFDTASDEDLTLELA